MGVKTTKPISTISYNTLAFLVLKLEELRRGKILSFWALIQHKGEKGDETPGKDHIHLFMIPARSVQTADIELEFVEPVPNNKPLKTTMIRSSKFDDWAMYVLHNKAYLQTKGLSREFEYVYADFLSSDDDTLLEMFRLIDFSKLSPISKVVDAVDDGMSWSQFVRSGTFPVQQINSFRLAFEAIQREKLLKDSDSLRGDL